MPPDSPGEWPAEEVDELVEGPNGTGRLVLWREPGRVWPRNPWSGRIQR